VKHRKSRPRHRSRRDPVRMSDNVGPTAETLAHLKPWPIERLRAARMITEGEFGAACKIVAAYKFITAAVGFKPLDLARIGKSHGDLGDSGERVFAIYIRWGNSVQATLASGGLFVRPHVFVELIEDTRPIRAYWLRPLVLACQRWQRFSTEYDDAQAAKLKPERHTIMVPGAEPPS